MPASLTSRAVALVRAQRSFNTLVMAAVAVGFVILVGVSALAVSVMIQNFNFTDLVAHTYKVQTAIADFRTMDERIETARRGFLLSHDERFADTVRTVKGQLDGQLDALARLTADNPVQRANIVRLRDGVRRQFTAIDVSMAFARGGANNTSGFYGDAGAVAIRDNRTVGDAMLAEEQKKLTIRDAARLASVRVLIAISIAAAVMLVIVALGSLGIILRYTRDLTKSREDLAALNLGLEDQVSSRTADLQRANEEIQRFAYIVSHDLRSPLVNVMGFTAELEAAAKPLSVLLERAEAEAPQIVTADARAAVRLDLPESIGFIRTSTQKMDRLINAILQLSRQGRRILAPEPVDVTRLAESIADNLKHRCLELGAEIVVADGLPMVVSDRLALEQIFSNLMENALKYLKPGRPGRIEVTGEVRGRRLIYNVTDNGRGVAPKDHDRIFDLFRRAGVQDQPGEGIGLAHVRALAYRLGGTVSCQSTLDQGATFQVSLPANLTTEGAR